MAKKRAWSPPDGVKRKPRTRTAKASAAHRGRQATLSPFQRMQRDMAKQASGKYAHQTSGYGVGRTRRTVYS